jgi:hypothetical protein
MHSLLLPMPADFGVRLAFGLAAMLLISPWRVVPPAFFRTQCLVMLVALVASALVEGRGVPSGMFRITIAAGIASYLASVAWGLGVVKLGWPLTLLVAACSAFVLIWASPTGTIGAGISPFDAASRLASALLLGSTLTAMLLGHHYLTAPAMSIDPLRRFVAAMGISLAVRTGLAAVALVSWVGDASSSTAVGPMFLGMRWGMGVIGPALAAALAWKTLRIRSTQSATGILYVGMTLVLFGELAGMILGRDGGAEF